MASQVQHDPSSEGKKHDSEPRTPEKLRASSPRLSCSGDQQSQSSDASRQRHLLLCAICVVWRVAVCGAFREVQTKLRVCAKVKMHTEPLREGHHHTTPHTTLFLERHGVRGHATHTQRGEGEEFVAIDVSMWCGCNTDTAISQSVSDDTRVPCQGQRPIACVHSSRVPPPSPLTLEARPLRAT